MKQRFLFLILLIIFILVCGIIEKTVDSFIHEKAIEVDATDFIVVSAL